VAACVVIVLGGTAGLAVYLVREYVPLEDEEQKHQRSQGNFAFKPPKGWKEDMDLRLKMRVHLAMTRPNPKAHMALFYRDFKTRLPSDGELVDIAARKLFAYFRKMEYENPLEKETKGYTGELGGEQAIVLDFVATGANEVVVRGQCYLMTRQGYGYWLFTWGAQDDYEDLQPRWEKLREGLKLFDEREGWSPQPRKTDTFEGEAVPCALNYATEVWRREENAKDYDGKAELALRGFEPIENEETGTKRIEEYAGKAATVLVLVLPPAADLKAGAAAAREYVRKRKTDEVPSVKIEEMLDRQTKKPVVFTEVGALHGQVNKLRVKLADTEKYAVLGVVSRPEGVVAIYCECPWSRQTYWDPEFMALLKSVHLKGR
jgi:hypothetical protein